MYTDILQAAHLALAERFSQWVARMDALIAKDPNAAFDRPGSELPGIVAEVADVVSGPPPLVKEDAAGLVARKLFARVYEGGNMRAHVAAYIAAMAALRDAAYPRMAIFTTNWFVNMEDDRKFHREIGEALVRARLLQLPELDTHLAKVGLPAGGFNGSVDNLAKQNAPIFVRPRGDEL